MSHCNNMLTFKSENYLTHVAVESNICPPGTSPEANQNQDSGIIENEINCSTFNYSQPPSSYSSSYNADATQYGNSHCGHPLPNMHQSQYNGTDNYAAFQNDAYLYEQSNQPVYATNAENYSNTDENPMTSYHYFSENTNIFQPTNLHIFGNVNEHTNIGNDAVSMKDQISGNKKKDLYEYFALPCSKTDTKKYKTSVSAVKDNCFSLKSRETPSNHVNHDKKNGCKKSELGTKHLYRSRNSDSSYYHRNVSSRSSTSTDSYRRNLTSSNALNSIGHSYSTDSKSESSSCKSSRRSRSSSQISSRQSIRRDSHCKDRQNKRDSLNRKNSSLRDRSSSNPKSDQNISFEIEDKHMLLNKNEFLQDTNTSEDDLNNKFETIDDTEVSWTRCTPADLYYYKNAINSLVSKATPRLEKLCQKFEEKILKRADRARAANESANEEKKKCEEIELSNSKSVDTMSAVTQIDPVKEKCSSIDKSSINDISSSTTINQNRLNEKQQDSHEIDGKDRSKDEPIALDCDSTTTDSVKNISSMDRERNNACESLNRKCSVFKSESNSKSICRKNDRNKKLCFSDCSSSDDDNSSIESSSEGSDDDYYVYKGVEELEQKKNHPDRLHPDLWFNDAGEMNDGPLCRCSLKARRSGIRHGFYVGEEKLPTCDPWSNNADRLHHYLVTISPPTNFLVKSPTIICHDSHEFIFEGFSLLSHQPLEELPTCQVIRFNIEYSVIYVKDKMPENFCIKELDMFYEFLFKEILELKDLNLKAPGDEEGCPRFHFLPRFVRKLPANGKEILSMNEVISYFIKCSGPLIREDEISKIFNFTEHEWLAYTDHVKGMIVTYPGKKPCSIRVDQLDRSQDLSDRSKPCSDKNKFPAVVHFGIRPPQLCYAGNPNYQKALREYVKFRHLLANMAKPSFDHKRQLEVKEIQLQEMRMGSSLKRDVTIDTSSENFFRTGIMCDVVQHALLIPVLVRHLRFHQSLNKLEECINYKFKNRYLLQLALTHPSYRENFGTNPDHARNSLTNCGVRQLQYGDRKIQYMNTHKRGINTLVNIMSQFGRSEEATSKITHNERLEFLGDAVVEFLSSIHLFHLFPSLEEGGLATYRAAVVQNQHLSVLAKKLNLNNFILHAHGSDLCHTYELSHAMANCFEALMGAIFIDSNIEACDAVFSATLFKGESELHEVWVNYKPHPLQAQEPSGDRKWIETFPVLQKIAEFEGTIGLKFTHIRLLARAFTDRSIGFNYLTLGSNQRLEFLGDTVLQIIASEYLYRFFPEHHEGHLSLLRSSLVNNRTQAVVCNDLNMPEYAIYSKLKNELKTKDRADLLEAFLGALYIDLGLDYCRKFCDVCFFPRLQHFIINQEWNDPKSKLQQCCLTLRSMEGGEPDIPIYKVIECKGPTNTRIYTVAVYFRAKRLAKASGHSIQRAEMNAASEALLSNKELFPQLAYQRRVIDKNIMNQGVYLRKTVSPSSNKTDSSSRTKRYRDETGKFKEPHGTSLLRRTRSHAMEVKKYCSDDDRASKKESTFSTSDNVCRSTTKVNKISASENNDSTSLKNTSIITENRKSGETVSSSIVENEPDISNTEKRSIIERMISSNETISSPKKNKSFLQETSSSFKKCKPSPDENRSHDSYLSGKNEFPLDMEISSHCSAQKDRSSYEHRIPSLDSRSSSHGRRSSSPKQRRFSRNYGDSHVDSRYSHIESKSNHSVRRSPFNIKAPSPKIKSSSRNSISPHHQNKSSYKSRTLSYRSRYSPNRRRYSPSRSRCSPNRRRCSPNRSRYSPNRSRYSPKLASFLRDSKSQLDESKS